MVTKTDGTTAPKPQSNAEKVIAPLKRKEGATLEEMVHATGWLPHIARAAMTGLRRKGHGIERTKLDGVSRYAITAKTRSGA